MNATMLKKQREYRRKNGNAITKKYERTKKGKLMRLYRNMQSRVNGIQWRKAHLYEGKEILDRDEFYHWALSSKEFHEMFAAWEASGFDRRLVPTVDRIDTDKGYIVSNMRWLTHSENSRLGTITRNKMSRKT